VEDDLAEDPIITGDKTGIGWAIVNFVGSLLAIPFRLLNYGIETLEKIAEAGGATVEEATPSTALALSEGTKAAKRQVEALEAVHRKAAASAPAIEAKTAPALAAQAAPAAPSAPAAAAAAPAAGEESGGKAKFDKQAMLARIRDKKAQKG
jgi:hypothetical protein